MKTEPLDKLDVRVHGINALEDNLSNFNKAEEVDIKYVFPTSFPTIQQQEALFSPIPTEGWNATSTSYSFHNENDDDGDSQAELDEIKAIISECEVDVKDVKPVVFPIPIITPDVDDKVGSKKIKTKPNRTVVMKKPKPCICTICNTGFPSQQLFQLHMSNEHIDQRPYQCSHCGKGFTSITNLMKHESIHDPKRFEGEPTFACDLCDKKYHLKVTLDCHRKVQHLGYKPPKRSHKALIIEHHAIGVRNPNRPKKIKRLFKCPHCDLTFEMRCHLQGHLICHTESKPHQCHNCGQRYSSIKALRFHLKNIHLNPTASCIQKISRPRSMANEPCPCTVCGKMFKVPSKLQTHMLLHTGEKPHECRICKQRFRIRQGLTKHQLLHINKKEEMNEYNTFKCLICGKNGLLRFADLQGHRLKAHRHIPKPADPDKEKPYACGVCGKPYYTRCQAIVCALLKHDPTTLLATLFKIKCEACPEGRFGFHSTLALRRHWEKDHTDKPFPVKYRASSGMYEKRKVKEDSLPTITINKQEAKIIRKKGPPKREFDFPLYTEFELLPVEVKFFRDLKKAQKRESKPEPNITCDICGVLIAYKSNLKRHMKTHEEGKGFQLAVRAKRVVARYNCNICSKRFLKLSRLRFHERQHNNLNSDGTPLVKRRPGRPAKRTSPLKQVATAKIKGKVGRPRKQLLSTDLVVNEYETAGSSYINLNDAVAVNSILDNRVACIVLPKVTAISNNTGEERQIPIIDKVVKIILRRVDEEELS